MLNDLLRKYYWALLTIGALLWVGLHIPSIQYGTHDVPLYITYVGDEQVPINGALHVLNEKNIFALREANKAYYGPLMVMLAVPPTVADFIRAMIFEGVSSPLEYRNYVVWNWGGILQFSRIFSVAIGFLGLYLLGRILLLPVINPRKKIVPVVLVIVLLASEYFYFHYTAQFRHWVYLNVILLGQLYLYFRMQQSGFVRWWHWMLQAGLSILTFGISYLGILFQAVWGFAIVSWLWNLQSHTTELKRFATYSVLVCTGWVLIVLWHPYAFFRILGIVNADLQNDQGAHILEEDYGSGFSFSYYSELFFNNHIGIMFAVLVLCGAVWMLRVRMRVTNYGPVCLLLVAYVLLFGFQSHHSTHYFLPAIILVHVLAGMVFVQSVSEVRYRFRTVIIPLATFFFGIQLAFNGAVIGKLLEFLRTPPPELALAHQLIALQESKGGKTLLSGCGPLGVPHTREAYADFVSRAERYKTNLYTTILSTDFPFPKDSTLLDAYYDDNLPEGERIGSKEYERVVICRVFNPEGDPNLRLLHEVNLFNYWNLKPYMDRYEFVQPASLKGLYVEGIGFK